MADPKPLPCPFCGHSIAAVRYIRDGARVVCHCGAASSPEFNGPESLPSTTARAMTAWNTRALTEDHARLKAAAEDAR